MLPDWFYAVGQVVSWVCMLSLAVFLIWVIVQVEQEKKRLRRGKADV